MNEIGRYVIIGIAIIAILAIGWVFVQYSGVPVPGWFVMVVWIVVAAVFCIGAVKLIMRMMNSP